MEHAEKLRAAVRDVPDFPQPGIIFKDITPILSDGALFRTALTQLTGTVGTATIDKVAGIDARGFIFGASVADRLNAGFVPLRKHGKLPYKTECRSYALEYGEATIEIHEDAILPGENVLLIDDLLATGGTAGAAVELIRKLQGNLVAASFLIELTFLNGRDKLPSDVPIHAIIQY
jgi:adenine phosphoribosyltransferase